MTLVQLCLGIPELDLAHRFGMSQSSGINLMYLNFKAIVKFPSWSIVKKHMPEIFKKEYPNTRIL